MKTITLVYFNAGGGHRAAAVALQEAIRAERRPWRVELVNLFDVLDPKGLFRRLSGVAPEELYNRRLAKGWTLGLAQELKLLQRMIRLGHAPMLRQLRQHWLAGEPDLVVSLVPNFNRVLCESVAGALPGVPFVTVLTDIADLPPNFWIEPGQDQYLVCGSDRALAQARAAGYPDTRLFLTSGMILRPHFYRSAVHDRATERTGLGLPPDAPVAVVCFGGHGSMAMLKIARQLDDLPLILLCGHNQLLADRLRALERTAPHVVLGYTDEMQRWLRLGDFLIGKPGPGSLSEAIHLGLPVVTTRNAWTMPQERYNTEWLSERGLGIVHGSMRTLRAGVDAALARLPELRANCARIDNRAVFELPQIFESLLLTSAAPPRWVFDRTTSRAASREPSPSVEMP
jgi:UDP-N-acetylglucosamine:LPS N-acetylglucosamine transferase